MHIYLNNFSNILHLNNDFFYRSNYYVINESTMIEDNNFLYSWLIDMIESGVPLQDGVSMMYCGHYFYHPVHGLCTCGEVLNMYKKKKHMYTVYCDCYDRIVHPNYNRNDPDNYDEEYWLKYGQEINAHVPQNYFPKNYRKVLKIETITVNGRPVVCVYALNVLDVMQTDANHYEVGIGIFYFIMDKDIYSFDRKYMIFYPYFTKEVVEQCAHLGLKKILKHGQLSFKEIKLLGLNELWEQGHLSLKELELLSQGGFKECIVKAFYDRDAWSKCFTHRNIISSDLINKNKSFLTQECMNHILKWHSDNLISKNDLFFHALTKDDDDPLNPRYLSKVFLHIKHK